MKKLTNYFFAVLLCATSIFASCKKSEEVQAPLVITKADYNNNYKPNGTPYSTFSVSASAVTVPSAGENQTWDFSNLTEQVSYSNGGTNFTTASNAEFGGATYAYAGTSSWAVSGASSPEFTTTTYIEVGDIGVYDVGYSQNQTATISVPSLGATISYPIQNIVYTGATTKFPYVLFPAKMGNAPITINNFVKTSNYNVTAAAFGLNNTPAQTKNTYNVTQEVIGSGKVKLKGIGEVRALLIKNTWTERTNYFLGGAPAPAALLSNLGVTDGESTTKTTYRFLAEGLGTVGVIEVNASGSITGTNFRKG